MPTDRLTNQFTYNFDNQGKLKETYLSLELATVFKQTRVPSDKNGKQDYKAPTDGYNLLNLNVSTIVSIGKVPVTFSIGARNLLNKSYREYQNSFRYFTDDIGRNLSFRIKVPLENFIK